MEDLVYRCPICHGNVLAEDVADPHPNHVGRQAGAPKLYCPHCEMLVEAFAVTPGALDSDRSLYEEGAAAENRGRSREGGTNAGGAQRGDLSDQGATQWRQVPNETERNTWQDKD